MYSSALPGCGYPLRAAFHTFLCKSYFLRSLVSAFCAEALDDVLGGAVLQHGKCRHSTTEVRESITISSAENLPLSIHTIMGVGSGSGLWLDPSNNYYGL